MRVYTWVPRSLMCTGQHSTGQAGNDRPGPLWQAHPHSSAILSPAQLCVHSRSTCDHGLQEDIGAPKHYMLHELRDSSRHAAMASAIKAAVQQAAAAGLAPRVLLQGCGVGQLALEALAAGAAHVACVDRWVGWASDFCPHKQLNGLQRRPGSRARALIQILPQRLDLTTANMRWLQAAVPGRPVQAGAGRQCPSRNLLGGLHGVRPAAAGA
jgi:hypothetical protein